MNNNTNYLKIKLFLLLFYFKTIYSISSSSNEPLPPNELGETAKDCSLQYCTDKDGMALWLSLQNVCMKMSANPYFFEINDHVTSSHMENNGLSPLTLGSIFACISLISFFMGYMISQDNIQKRDMINEKEYM
jgi:hypothetical protein